MERDRRRLKIAIIGGGLVGSLSASFFAQRGHDVHLYEYRDDIRVAVEVRGRSINLAMSERGRTALRVVGLEESLVAHHGIPMSGRMIHSLDGSLKSITYDPRNHQCIYSVGRKYLNEVLLTAAEKFPNVTLNFNHKLVAANLERGDMTFELTSTTSGSMQVVESADLIVGADGAFSAVRRQMLKQPDFNFSQKYIEHGYIELCIPPDKAGGFAMHENRLHIWPRGTFMLIALPNQDMSWTVTLFMPFSKFGTLDSPESLIKFFKKYFSDVIPLIGEARLVADFFSCKPSPLITIKCHPYHVADKAILIGDAAHAMVPFYGQGMNAGFEDCLLLDNLMLKYDGVLTSVLKEYSATRNKDAEAICDLAVYNYVEMRDLVNRRSFLLRKKLDNFLEWLMPNTWTPLYTSVTFSNTRYHQCIANKKWQDKIVLGFTVAVGALGLMSVITGVYFVLQTAEISAWCSQTVETMRDFVHLNQMYDQ